MNKYLNGALAYFGSKTKLAKKIVSYFEGETVADAFLGGGSVSIWSKVNNFQVLCNDHQRTSVELGKAIIENNNIYLTKYDLLKIYNTKFDETKHKDYDLIKKLFIIPQHTNFISKCSYLVNVENIFKSETKKAMINLLLIKYMLSIRPYSNFCSNLYGNILNNDTIYSGSTIKSIKRILTPSIKIASLIMKKINSSIFNNNKHNKVYNLDVIEFVKQINCNTLYLDPPYKGSSNYEDYYSSMNKILYFETKEKSKFNKRDYIIFFKDLLTNSLRFNKIVISYSGPETNNVIKLCQETGKNVEVIKVPFKYSIKGRENQDCFEYIIILV